MFLGILYKIMKNQKQPTYLTIRYRVRKLFNLHNDNQSVILNKSVQQKTPCTKWRDITDFWEKTLATHLTTKNYINKRFLKKLVISEKKANNHRAKQAKNVQRQVIEETTEKKRQSRVDDYKVMPISLIGKCA